MTVTQPPDELDRHRLARHHFGDLAAGGGDAGTVEELLAAEHSWRLLQLRAVLDAVAGTPEVAGPLPPVAEAWALLVAAQRRAPAAVDRLIAHPHVGTWAGYVLRRLRGSTVTADGPLWADLGYLHALAAVAGVRAGLSFASRVPVRDGFVALPTLGGAVLPATQRWAVAEVAGADGAASVALDGHRVAFDRAGGGADGWFALPTVRAEAGGQTLTVGLDFLDPYRNLRSPTPPDLDTVAAVDRWRTLLTQAWELLVRVCPERAAPIARGLFSVVPQRPAERFRTMSASAGDAFGSMLISEPEDAPELAVTLVHEFQHIKLGGLLHLTPLLTAEPPHRLYAPWRDDPRPLGGLLQGVYAFVGITEFWRAYRPVATGAGGPVAHFEFARWRRQVTATVAMLRARPELTDVGRRLLDGLAATAETWRSEPVPAEVLAAADAAVDDHRAQWRLHHRRPDPAVVRAFAEARRAGTARPDTDGADPPVVVDAAARRLDTRAVLLLWRLTDPEGFDSLCKDPSTVGERVTGAGPADLAYAAGDTAQAHHLRRAELAAGPGSPSAWAGLALTSAALGLDEAAAALRSRPELVRAMHAALLAAGTPADPVELAAWIGPAPTAG
ncbi:HEXXH motif domain-containing protein [Micromonospora sp. NPDC051300]|uniref:HEXXH motif domain-containing protein n=1 Tax=Micromonospora sp. NPDC051300 TaxID=3364286 RepID=UPI0037B66218